MLETSSNCSTSRSRLGQPCGKSPIKPKLLDVNVTKLSERKLDNCSQKSSLLSSTLPLQSENAFNSQMPPNLCSPRAGISEIDLKKRNEQILKELFLDNKLELNGNYNLNKMTGCLTRIYRMSHGFLNLINHENGQHLFEEYAKQIGIEDHLFFWFALEGFQKRYSDYEDRMLIDENDESTLNVKNDLLQMAKTIYNNFIKPNAKFKVYKWFNDGTRQLIFGLIQTAIQTNKLFEKHLFLDARIEFEKQMNANHYNNFLQSDIYKQFVREQLQLSLQKQALEVKPTALVTAEVHMNGNKRQSIASAHNELNESIKSIMSTKQPISRQDALNPNESTNSSSNNNQSVKATATNSSGLSNSEIASSIEHQSSIISAISSGIQSDSSQDNCQSLNNCQSPGEMETLKVRKILARYTEIRAKIDAFAVDQHSMISSQSMREGFHLPNDPKKNMERVHFFVSKLEDIEREQLHAGEMKVLHAIEKIERNGAPNMALRNAIKSRILNDLDSQSILDQHCQRVFRSSDPNSRDSGSSSPVNRPVDDRMPHVVHRPLPICVTNSLSHSSTLFPAGKLAPVGAPSAPPLPPPSSSTTANATYNMPLTKITTLALNANAKNAVQTNGSQTIQRSALPTSVQNNRSVLPTTDCRSQFHSVNSKNTTQKTALPISASNFMAIPAYLKQINFLHPNKPTTNCDQNLSHLQQRALGSNANNINSSNCNSKTNTNSTISSNCTNSLISIQPSLNRPNFVCPQNHLSQAHQHHHQQHHQHHQQQHQQHYQNHQQHHQQQHQQHRQQHLQQHLQQHPNHQQTHSHHHSTQHPYHHPNFNYYQQLNQHAIKALSKIRTHQPPPQPFAGSMLGSSLPPAMTVHRPLAQKPYTVIKYQYANEMPYSIRIDSPTITLRQFKQIIIKKSLNSNSQRIRYFFKRKDEEDSDNEYTMEELIDDDDLVPLCNSKVVAKLEIVQI